MKKILLAIATAVVLTCLLSIGVLANEVVDPRAASLLVVVNTAEGESTVTVEGSSLYAINSSNAITGVNAKFSDTQGVEYSSADLVKATIPAGIKALKSSAFKSLASLKEVEVLDGANLTFESQCFNSCSALEKLTVDESSVLFVANCVSNCTKLSTLDLTKADAKFNDNAFKGNTVIANLLLGSGHTYNFGSYAFHGTGLKEVIFPDYSSVTVKQKSFGETQTIEYVYIGYEALKSSGNRLGDDNTNYSVFGGNGSLSKVVLMDVTYVGKWVFSTKTSGNLAPRCDLYVYAHSEEFSFNSTDFTFNDRKTGGHKVFLFTADPDMASDVGYTSNYVVYKGLGHKYTLENVSESTCSLQGMSRYVTDCPCGIDYFGNEYTSVSNFDATLNNVTHPALAKEIALPLLPHTAGDSVAFIDYKNGLAQKGTKLFACTNCGKAATEEAEASAEAIFKDLGYSFSSYSPKSFSRTISVNKSAYDTYCQMIGSVVEFGVAAAIEEVVNTNKLINADGSTVTESVAALSCTDGKNSMFEMKIVGVDGYEDMAAFCTGYYIANGFVYYLDGVNSQDTASAITYNQLING